MASAWRVAPAFRLARNPHQPQSSWDWTSEEGGADPSGGGTAQPQPWWPAGDAALCECPSARRLPRESTKARLIDKPRCQRRDMESLTHILRICVNRFFPPAGT